LGQLLTELLPKRKLEPLRPALAWAVGRIGAREPVYGPLNTVVPAADAGRWLEQLIELDDTGAWAEFAVVQLARKTGDRYRDLPDTARDRTVGWLDRHGAAQHAVELVQRGGHLDTAQQTQVFGEALPKGLRIR
jgi:hypothetical protein